MALVYKHWTVTGEQVRRIEADPDSAESAEDTALLSYLTLPEEQRTHALGRFTVGRFELRDEGHTDCLHTGSVLGDDFEEIARGKVVDDLEDPDGLYEIYVPI